MPGPAAQGKTFAVGSRQGHKMEKIQMFPVPGTKWNRGKTGRMEGREGREPRRELNLLYFFYMPLLLREEIPMDFWPLSSKKKNSVMLLNNEL